MSDFAIPMRWDGECFVPANGYWAKRANQQFVVGAVYRMQEVSDRSTASHNHEFAWLQTAWENLPEHLSELYPTPEALRKRALIEAGFYDEQIVDAGTKAAAIRVATAFRSREEFSVIIVRGCLVVLRTAKSQSRRSMDKKDFQASKQAIMEVIAAMIGVTPESLSQRAA